MNQPVGRLTPCEMTMPNGRVFHGFCSDHCSDAIRMSATRYGANFMMAHENLDLVSATDEKVGLTALTDSFIHWPNGPIIEAGIKSGNNACYL